jgi:hypothetical protein
MKVYFIVTIGERPCQAWDYRTEKILLLERFLPRMGRFKCCDVKRANLLRLPSSTTQLFAPKFTRSYNL